MNPNSYYWKRMDREVTKLGGRCVCCGNDYSTMLYVSRNFKDAPHRRVLCKNCGVSKIANRGVCVHEYEIERPDLRRVK